MKTLLLILTCTLCVVNFAQIPTDNLVLYLPFNGDANDISGNDLNAIVSGATLSTDRFDIENYAYEFDGVSDHMTIPTSPDLELEFPFSVSLWFYRDELPDEAQMLFKVDANDDAYSGYWINMSETGLITAVYGDALGGLGPGNRVSKRSSSPPAVGEWHHVLAVFNGENDTDLYIDCELDPGYYSGSGSTVSYFGEPTKIGRYDWRVFEGKIDHIRVYDDAITPEEVLTFCEEEPCIETIYIHEVIRDTVVYIDTLTYIDTVTYIDTLTHIDTIIFVDTVTFIDTITFFDTIYVQTSSINEINFNNNQLKIYPNPTQDFLLIEIENNVTLVKGYQIEILDINGKVILQQPLEQHITKLDLRSLKLSNSTYFLRIKDNQFAIIETRKFIFKL